MPSGLFHVDVHNHRSKMRLCPTHIRNFYGEEGGQRMSSTANTPPAEGDAESLPQPYGVIQPTTRHPNSSSHRKHSSATPAFHTVVETRGSNSSASIEDVISWSSSISPASTPTPTSAHNPPSDGECASLRQLQYAVDEAKRDVRRLRALMVRAVWQALTQASSEQQGSGSAAGRKEAAVRFSSHMPKHAQGGGVHHADGASVTPAKPVSNTGTAFSTLSCDATDFFNEKPFLPPDRYPTLPPLTENDDTFRVNLSRALFAAHRAGLLEKQRTWLQRRQQPSTSSLSLVRTGASGAASSARQTALQRVSSLSTAVATTGGSSVTSSQRLNKVSRAPSAKHNCGVADVACAGKEDLVQSSISLIILRVAKDRAVATLFLRQLRLVTYQRRLLRENVVLRYTYYLQRRVLRNWCVCAHKQHLWHVQLLYQVVSHWQQYIQRRHTLRQELRRWRWQLRQRAGAFAACQRAQLARYWQEWTRTFTWHRERSGLYETAAQFATSHRRTHFGGLRGDRELLALLHGAPVAAKEGGVVATPVGHRLALQRLFQAWKVKTTRQLMARVAAWHYVKAVRRRVVLAICARARVLALRDHHQRNEAKRLASTHTTDGGLLTEASATAAAAAVGVDVSLLTPTPPQPQRAPMRVFAAKAARHELLKYKANAAWCITYAARLRCCFRRWQARFQARCADLYRRQHLEIRVLRCWLHALTLHRQQKEWQALVLHRWVSATRHRQDAANATRLHFFFSLNRVLHRWRAHFTLRVVQAEHRRRGCFQQWRERAALRAGTCALRQMKLRRLLRQWHARAQTRVDTRAHLYVADTLFETGMLLGCIRRWRYRSAEHRRIRLVWAVFVQLRCERVCRDCFALWRRRVFGLAVLRKQKNDTAFSSTLSPLV